MVLFVPYYSPTWCRSSYYNSPVTVDITYCREVDPSVYEREVEISVFGRVFCIAKSLVVSQSSRLNRQQFGE